MKKKDEYVWRRKIFFCRSGKTEKGEGKIFGKGKYFFAKEREKIIVEKEKLMRYGWRGRESKVLQEVLSDLKIVFPIIVYYSERKYFFRHLRRYISSP